jgi:hypothetical protein
LLHQRQQHSFGRLQPHAVYDKHSKSKKVDEKVKEIDSPIEELFQIKNMLINGVAQCLNSCEPAAGRN